MYKFQFCLLRRTSLYLVIVVLVSAFSIAATLGQQPEQKPPVSTPTPAQQPDQKPPDSTLTPTQKYELDSLSKQGMEAYGRADFNKAENMWKQGLDRATALDNMTYVAPFLFNLGIVCKNLHRNDKALEYYTRSLATAEKIGNQGIIAISLLGLGEVSSVLGQSDKAIDYNSRALAIAEKIGDSNTAATSSVNIGTSYVIAGQSEKALDYYIRGLAIAERIGNQADTAIALYGLGLGYLNAGQNDKALDYDARALAIAEKSGDSDAAAKSSIDLGTSYANLGQNDKALDYYTRSLSAAEKIGNQGILAASLAGLGSVSYVMSQIDKALDYYTRALAIAEKIESESSIADSLTNLGSVYYNAGKCKEALDYFTRAFAIAVNIGNQAHAARALNGLGLVYFAIGQTDKALDDLAKALAIQEKIGNQADIAATLSFLGDVFTSAGRLDEAEQRFADSRRLQEQLSWQVSDPTQVGALQERYHHFYERYASLRLKRNLPEEALEMLEAGLGQGLVRQIDLTERGDITLYYTASEKAELREKTRLLRNSQVRLRYARQQAEDAAESNRVERTKQVDLAGEDAGSAEREYDLLRDSLYARHPEAIESAENTPAKFVRLRTLAKDHPDTLYLECGVVDDKTALLFALGEKDGLKPLQLPVGEKELTGIAQRWRQALDAAGGRGPAIANPDLRVRSIGDETAAAREAFQALLGEASKAGLLAAGRYRRLVFVGSGPMLEMPLAAMIDPSGKRLIERFSVSHAFSLSSFFYRSAVEKPTRTVLCVADPTGPEDHPQPAAGKLAVSNSGRSAFRGGFLPLPGARDEGKAVAALFAGSELLIGPKAREQKVTDEMKDFQLLHFATHGYLIPSAVQSSGLVLAEEPGDTGTGTGAGGSYDGLLTVRKIVNLSTVWKRSMAAQLAVLSACETGRGVSQEGEGLMGLAWAFRAAGCPSLVVSQWAVDDAATKEWMLTFYGALKAGKQKDDAVRAAMLAVKKSHPSPFYWAAFDLIGNASPITMR